MLSETERRDVDIENNVCVLSAKNSGFPNLGSRRIKDEPMFCSMTSFFFLTTISNVALPSRQLKVNTKIIVCECSRKILATDECWSFTNTRVRLRPCYYARSFVQQGKQPRVV